MKFPKLNGMNVFILCIGIIIGIFLAKKNMVPELFEDTPATTSKEIPIPQFAKIILKPKGNDFENPVYFTRNDFDMRGKFSYARVNQDGLSEFFVNIYDQGQKTVMSIGTDRKIKKAKINTDLLRSDEKCIVQSNQIMIVPSSHPDIPEEDLVMYDDDVQEISDDSSSGRSVGIVDSSSGRSG